MLDKDALARIREEHEVMETWRIYSRQAIAEFLEACPVCGAVREKSRLVHCRWCEDTYCCKEGVCIQQHHAEVHPGVAFWTW